MDCYTTAANIYKITQNDFDNYYYYIQVDATHTAEHNSNHQKFMIYFNLPVEIISSPGLSVVGNYTNILQIDLNFWNNYSDRINFNNLIVKAPSGLIINETQMIDIGKC